MSHKNRGAVHAVRRMAAVGLFGIALAGAAHASYNLESTTFIANAEIAANAPSLDLAGNGLTVSSSGSAASSAVGGGPSAGSTVWMKHFGAPPPAPTPEPITMGVSVFGLGLAARRARRRAK